MNADKAKAIELGEAAGEAFAKQLLQDGGVPAMQAAAKCPAWMEACVERRLYAHPDVHPLEYKAFGQTFARGAARFTDQVLRGYRDGGQAPRSLEEKMLAAAPMLHRPEYSLVSQAVKAANPNASAEEVLDAFFLHLHQRVLGDRPALIEAYNAGRSARLLEG